MINCASQCYINVLLEVRIPQNGTVFHQGSDKQAIFLHSCGQSRRFLLISPRWELSFLVILLMCIHFSDDPAWDFSQLKSKLRDLRSCIFLFATAWHYNACLGVVSVTFLRLSHSTVWTRFCHCFPSATPPPPFHLWYPFRSLLLLIIIWCFFTWKLIL